MVWICSYLFLETRNYMYLTGINELDMKVIVSDSSVN